jgi:hypothetical protein
MTALRKTWRALLLTLVLGTLWSAGCADRVRSLPLGQSARVTAGRTYRVGDVTLTVQGVAMATGVDSAQREVHQIMMDLRIHDPQGQDTDLSLVGDAPREAAGLEFRAEALGFQWGATPATATLLIRRK